MRPGKMLRTDGNRQTVQISSKGDIRGESITMVVRS
jgi:hypothetical protein